MSDSPALHDDPAAAAAPAAHAVLCSPDGRSLTDRSQLTCCVSLCSSPTSRGERQARRPIRAHPRPVSRHCCLHQLSNPIVNPIDALWIGCELQQCTMSQSVPRLRDLNMIHINFNPLQLLTHLSLFSFLSCLLYVS